MGIQNNLTRIMVRALERQGYHVSPNRMMGDRFRTLVPSPDMVIDVGVGPGTPWLYGAFPELPFLLVDPMVEAKAQVAETYPALASEFFATALGEAEGSVTLNIPHKRGVAHGPMASIFNRSDSLMSKVTGFDKREVPVTTLDALVGERSGRFGLKIDAEGAETQVLRGAARTLERCDFVVVELSLSQRFDEVEAPSTVISLLAEAGLEFRDVLEMNGETAALSPRHIDALFTRWPARQNIH
ncbi:MAG: hypothetical protein CML50_19055 [Rhodobacteraceae bacterium]|jgi:FkbM family methyltransferase|uniref:Methyltransferase, FkbM family n=1 Tax=Salipiger profundus TaxID=1229727 RepID=A0A1U7D1A4_9RHOB|nr:MULTISPECIES: FkbM family methyltransferase [Salipiger]APX21921.1 methyltransferase, FkbM family [Salipiger profundus]MAB08098.1 hypothetical protein [Paracoccaceae bacterium]GGA06237.1 hypothetical protein GCM10011326_17420 [Salipiger profundus]SFC37187.1 methyltransferase, FkbM family [Salipiger profundus]